MAEAATKSNKLSVAAYLEAERDGQVRHEYLDGQVYAMTGASRRHALIVNALAFALTPAARERGCALFTNDMKVRIDLRGRTFFYYPDLVLACDPEDREAYYVTRPCLVVEVLSPATERIDRREKLLTYIQLPSLQEYLLVSQDPPLVEIYRRRADWLPEEVTEGALALDCLGTELAVEAIYQDVRR
ncbi:MAG TPA: Uma2 family endonuclease [Chromatiales bacterium]|nr:Uma2 family endonuclease [Chromatiales bacterium]